jgi:tetratricopeptide (TPR) repeat protein
MKFPGANLGVPPMSDIGANLEWSRPSDELDPRTRGSKSMGERSIAARFDRLRRLSSGPFPATTIRYGRRYLIDDPENGVAWVYVGQALVEMARYEEAEQAFAKAIEHFPIEKRNIPLGQMGHLFDEAGDYDQAADWYRKAIDSRPGKASNYIYLGGVLAKQGRHHEAEEVLRRGTECAEGCIDEAYLNLGFVLRARERFDEAAECFRQTIRLDPNDREARGALRDVERCLRMKSRHD